MEALQGEGRPSTVPDEAFEAGAVVGLDADGGVEAEPATVVPGEHVLGIVGLQEAVAAEVSEHPRPHGVLEAVEELGRETGGFVEAEATGCALGVRIWIELFEDPVHDAEVEVKVGVEERAETMQKAHDPAGGGRRSGGSCLPQGGLESPKQDVEHRASGPGPVVEERPEALGDREDELADGDVGKDVVHQMGGGLGHAAGIA